VKDEDGEEGDEEEEEQEEAADHAETSSEKPNIGNKAVVRPSSSPSPGSDAKASKTSRANKKKNT